MVSDRVKRLEKKYVKNSVVCIVKPGDSKEKAILRSKINPSELSNIFFITIVGK